MPRPLTPNSLQVLSRIARDGIYFWSPGSVAILDNPGRNAVHVGSVAGLLKRDLVVGRGEFELVATAAGLQALEHSTSNRKPTTSVTIANTNVAVDVRGAGSTDETVLVGRRITDLLRVVYNREPRSWEAIVDQALTGQSNPALLEVVRATLAMTVYPDDQTPEPKLEISFTPVGPRLQS